nr:hypothetical protein [Nostoc sp. DedSLP05]
HELRSQGTMKISFPYSPLPIPYSLFSRQCIGQLLVQYWRNKETIENGAKAENTIVLASTQQY